MSLPYPESREEKYLAVMSGMTGVTLPEKPESRIEEYLAYLVENGTGGGGGGSMPVAGTNTLGGVMVGDGLHITAEGVLSLALLNADEEEF